MLTKDSLPSEITVDDVLTHPLAHVPKYQNLSEGKSVSKQIKEKRRALKLLKKAYDKEVYDDPTEKLGFLPPFFAQFSLPHVKPEYDNLKYGNPNYEISIFGPKGLPYGCFPRLFLAYICGEIRQTSSTVISINANQTQFLKTLDIPNTGRYATNFRNQAVRLLSTVICVEKFALTHNNDALDWSFMNCSIVRSGKFRFLARPALNEEIPAWESQLQLSEDFVKLINHGKFPFSYDTYALLKRSTLAMDIYTWANYRVFTLNKSVNKNSKGVAYIPFELLQNQFMPFAQTEARHFKKRFLKRMTEVEILWNDLKKYTDISKDGKSLIIKAGKPHIDPFK